MSQCAAAQMVCCHCESVLQMTEPMFICDECHKRIYGMAPTRVQIQPMILSEFVSRSASKAVHLREVQKHISALAPSKRVEVFQGITEGYCVHCGDVEPPDHRCNCQNDE